MPLTLSHPAAVLPLRRLGLPMSVLAIASMVPDLPLFMGWSRGYEATHSVLGIITIDLAIAIVAAVWWTFVMRDALVDLAPSPIRSRLPASVRLTRREWVLTPVAAVIGAATHLGWDAFTHHGRWGVDHVAWLRSEHAGLAGSSWAQYASGVIGLAIVAAAAAAHLAKAPVQTERPHRALPAATLIVVVTLGAMTGLLSVIRHASAGLHIMAFNAVVDSLIVFGVALVLVTAAWQIANQRRPASV